MQVKHGRKGRKHWLWLAHSSYSQFLGKEVLANFALQNVRVKLSPIVGDDVYIHLVVALSILGQVADRFAMRFLVAVNPVKPNLLLIHLLMQQRGLQGVLCVRD